MKFSSSDWTEDEICSGYPGIEIVILRTGTVHRGQKSGVHKCTVKPAVHTHMDQNIIQHTPSILILGQNVGIERRIGGTGVT